MNKHSNVNLIHTHESCTQCSVIEFDIYWQILCVCFITSSLCTTAVVLARTLWVPCTETTAAQIKHTSFLLTWFIFVERKFRETWWQDRGIKGWPWIWVQLSQDSPLVLKKTWRCLFKCTLSYWWLHKLNSLGNGIFRSQGTPSV